MSSVTLLSPAALLSTQDFRTERTTGLRAWLCRKTRSERQALDPGVLCKFGGQQSIHGARALVSSCPSVGAYGIMETLQEESGSVSGSQVLKGQSEEG